jgi:methionyl-tRNA synthetase
MITTPIFYANAEPHVGHLYTSLLADALARHHRMLGHRVLLATGTDEHGQKVADAAAAAGVAPQAFCDRVAARFRDTLLQSRVLFDDFVRTTEPRHAQTVTWLWKRLRDAGHIYLGEYNGWYSKIDEAFVPESQVRLAFPKGHARHGSEARPGDEGAVRVASDSGNPVEWVSEKNYKFRLSHFQPQVLRWLTETPELLLPAQRQREVVAWLRSAQLEDLSVSRLRANVQWAIPVPGDPEHGIYVWFDALANYLTTGGYPPSAAGGAGRGGESSSVAWPAEYQVLGKDILKFHAVYWPAMLMAGDVPLPRRLVAHGFWTVDGQKMSKSVGNVVSPAALVAQHGVDAVRYFLLKEGEIENDSDLSHAVIATIYNNDLADTLGNLVQRTTSSAFFPDADARLPPLDEPLQEADAALVARMQELAPAVQRAYTQARFSQGVRSVMALLWETNSHFQRSQPWALAKRPEARARLNTVLHLYLEALRLAGIALQPIVPESAERLLARLGVAPEERGWDRAVLGRPAGARLHAALASQPVLFPKLAPAKP